MYIKTMASWTPEEDKILLELYEKAPRKDILEKLPHRVWKSIYKRSVILGLYRPKEDAWTAEEDAILRELYINAPQEELEAKLPGRSWKAITFRGCNALRIFRSKEIKQKKVRQTNLLRRGVEYPTQSTRVKDKIKETVQKRYGVYNVFQAEEIKDKARETNLKNLGVENPQQNPTIKKKTEETCREKYGVSNPFQLVDRVQAGMLREHGVKSPLQNPDIKARQQATNIERYGAPVPAQNEKIREKLKLKLNTITVKEKKYIALKKRGTFPSSTEENELFPFLKSIDPDTGRHILHPVTKNVIDFYLPLFDIWIQYDGGYWHGKKKTIPGPQAINISKTIKRDKIQNELIPNLIRLDSEDIERVKKENNLQDYLKNKIEEKVENSCYQYRKKIQYYGVDLNSLPFNPDNLKASNFDLSYEEISDEITVFIEKYEWLGTIGVSPKWCFTARHKGLLGGVVLLNEPTAYSKNLGEDTPKYECLIQRGASASWTPKNLGSRLIMYACKWMINNTEKRFFIGYADLSAKERGIIYRACNFDFLGNDFGVSEMLQHPYFPRLFTAHSLKRTSMFIKWCRENNIILEKIWFKENGFKNIETIPKEVKNSWYDWCKKIVSESEKITIEKKLKFALVLGKNKRETKLLRKLKKYKPLPYPEKLNKNLTLTPVKNFTKNRKNPTKEKFIIDNYGKLTAPEIAKSLGESPRWVKRILKNLAKNGKITRKNPKILRPCTDTPSFDHISSGLNTGP